MKLEIETEGYVFVDTNEVDEDEDEDYDLLEELTINKQKGPSKYDDKIFKYLLFVALCNYGDLHKRITKCKISLICSLKIKGWSYESFCERRFTIAPFLKSIFDQRIFGTHDQQKYINNRCKIQGYFYQMD